MVWETHRILDDDTIQVSTTCVRITVFYGHSEAVYVETKAPLLATDARALLSDAPGVTVIDERTSGGYPTAVTEAGGTDEVFVGRIRSDVSHPRGLHLWVVSDNVRKGAALKSIHIAEALVKE